MQARQAWDPSRARFGFVKEGTTCVGRPQVSVQLKAGKSGKFVWSRPAQSSFCAVQNRNAVVPSMTACKQSVQSGKGDNPPCCFM